MDKEFGGFVAGGKDAEDCACAQGAETKVEDAAVAAVFLGHCCCLRGGRLESRGVASVGTICSPCLDAGELRFGRWVGSVESFIE